MLARTGEQHHANRSDAVWAEPRVSHARVRPFGCATIAISLAMEQPHGVVVTAWLQLSGNDGLAGGADEGSDAGFS